MVGKAIEFSEKTQNKAITPLKVIEFGINGNPVCDFLLVINTNIPYFGVIVIFRTLAFLSQPLGGCLGTTYDVYLGLIGKRVVDF